MIAKKKWLIILGALFRQKKANWDMVEVFMRQAVEMKYPETLTPLEAYNEIIDFWEDEALLRNS